MRYDYLFINEHLEIIGRHANKSYKSEREGIILGTATSPIHARKLADSWYGRFYCKYPTKLSEKLLG